MKPRQFKHISCRHFTGTINDSCKAGVCYSNLTKNNTLEIPCIPGLKNISKDQQVAECGKFSQPTEEEINQQTIEAKERIEFVYKARVLCVENSENKGFKLHERGADGSVKCPKCGNKLNYTRASINGHIWAECETIGCIRWVE